MYVTNVTDEYINNTVNNYTGIINDYDFITLPNCTYNENNIHIKIPTLLLTTPCRLSILFLVSLMVYTLVKRLFNNK